MRKTSGSIVFTFVGHFKVMKLLIFKSRSQQRGSVLFKSMTVIVVSKCACLVFTGYSTTIFYHSSASVRFHSSSALAEAEL